MTVSESPHLESYNSAPKAIYVNNLLISIKDKNYIAVKCSIVAFVIPNNEPDSMKAYLRKALQDNAERGVVRL
jgi:hypothetical protein